MSNCAFLVFGTKVTKVKYPIEAYSAAKLLQQRLSLLFNVAILFSIAVSRSLAAQDELKIDDFRPPSYSVYGLLLRGAFDKSYYEDNVGYRFEISPFFHSYSDMQEFDVSTWIAGNHRSYTTEGSLGASLSILKYLFSSPFFLCDKSDVGIHIMRNSYNTDDRWHNRPSGDIEVGCGMGHLREGSHIAYAMYINDLLLKEKIITSNLTNETISALAEAFSKTRYFSLLHDRPDKYVFQEVERILEKDPAYGVSVPIFTWFEIIEIIKEAGRFWWFYGTEYWNRMFGTRFAAYAMANDIDKSIYSDYDYYSLTKLQLFDSLYYIPAVRLVLEYAKPLDLRRQFTFSSSYNVAWYETSTHHAARAEIVYSYGIFKRLLLEGLIRSSYSHIYGTDTALYNFNGSPQVQCSYYVEDMIVLVVNLGCDFFKDREDFTASPFWGASVSYRLF